MVNDKKTTSISVDSLVLRKAKREIPNISVFVENCMRAYLNIVDSDDNVAVMQDELNKIKEAKLNLHLLSEVENNESSVKVFDDEKLNNAWSKLWRKAIKGLQISTDELNEASIVLNHDKLYLVDMIDTLTYTLHNDELSKCENWLTALNKYKTME